MQVCEKKQAEDISQQASFLPLFHPDSYKCKEAEISYFSWGGFNNRKNKKT